MTDRLLFRFRCIVKQLKCQIDEIPDQSGVALKHFEGVRKCIGYKFQFVKPLEITIIN